jgi:hypothetical protein
MVNAACHVETGLVLIIEHLPDGCVSCTLTVTNKERAMGFAPIATSRD